MTSHYPEFEVYKISKHCGMIFYFLMAILALQNRRESSKPPRKLKTAGFIREGHIPELPRIFIPSLKLKKNRKKTCEIFF